MKILVVEDETELANSIVEFIGKENFLTDSACDFKTAEQKIHLCEYDCALIDLMLPGGYGLDLVKLLKKQQPKCGVIIITAKDTLDDKLTGLNLGADDYITKPFYLAELNARINSVIRRRNFDGGSEIILNEITIDIQTRVVKIKGETIDLTKKEYELLLLFISNKERVLTRETIVEHIWGDDANTFDNFDFVYTHLRNLRRKIIDAGGSDYIKSVYGVGYKLSVK